MKSLPDTIAALGAECIELTRESDRGVILVGAAMLDRRLEQAIVARLRDDAKLAAELMGTDRAAGSFGSRIKLAYLLGLLTAEERRELDLIRRIRNKAAHVAGAATFNLFENQVRELTSRLPAETGVRAFGEPLSTRQRFIAVVTSLAWDIERVTASAPRLEEVARPDESWTISSMFQAVFRALPVMWEKRDKLGSGVEMAEVPLEDLVGALVQVVGTDGGVGDPSGKQVTPGLALVYGDAALSLFQAMGAAGEALSQARALDAATESGRDEPDPSAGSLRANDDRYLPGAEMLDAADEACHRLLDAMKASVDAAGEAQEESLRRIATVGIEAARRYEEAVQVLARLGVEAPPLPEAAAALLLPEHLPST